MKNIIKIILAFSFSILLCSIVTSSNTIVTSSNKYFSENDEVTIRDLALLTSLVYEDVPNDALFKPINGNALNNNGCKIDVNGNSIEECSYHYYEGAKYKRDGFIVHKYVEGMSKRKLNLFTAITTSVVEDGEMYYFLDYAQTEEASDWKVYNARTSATTSIENGGVFDAVTFKNKNNYVISYRGTDFPDVIEWLQDLVYVTGIHKQTEEAYNYAQEIYKQIINSDSNAKVYIVGHSLGGYLAQVGGAAITNYDRENNRKSQLVQVACFNGMGITALGINTSNNLVDSMIGDLVYLSTHAMNNDDSKGKEDAIRIPGVSYPSTDIARTVNYENTNTSGRLVLYRIDGDPVSELGIHLGEVIKLKPSIDSVTYHNGSHAILINGSFRQYFQTIPTSVVEYIKNSIEKIKNYELPEKPDYNFSESISKTISSIIKATNVNLVEENNNLFELSNMPKSIKGSSSRKTFLEVRNIIGYILTGEASKQYGKNLNIIETANISHETDSFLCLIDSNGGTPVVSSRVTNSDGKDLGTSVTSTIEESKTTEITLKEPTAILSADVSAGCARSYQWYKGEIDDLGNQLNTDITNSSYTINKSVMPKEGTVEYYTLKVTFGNSFTSQKISTNDGVLYEDAGTYGGLNDNAIYITFKVKYDDKGPICTLNKGNDTKNIVLETTGRLIKQIVSQQVDISIDCIDEGSGFSDDFKLSTNSFTIKNNGLIKTIEINNIYNMKKIENTFSAKINLSVKRVPTFLTPRLEYTSLITDAAGNDANVTNTVKFKISK